MNPLGIIGCGFLGETVLAQALEQARDVWVTTRQVERQARLQALGARVILLRDAEALPVEDADLIITHPPDPGFDARLSAVLPAARSCTYVSSTAVYGDRRGRIDAETPAAPSDERGRRRLAAEQRYRAQGACVLRAPGIYGPQRGVHRRLAAGSYRLTGDGSGYVSRIHVHDLARLCLAAGRPELRGTVHVVGDLRPSTQLELVLFLCEQMGLPMPPGQPAEQAHPSLRGDRRVDPTAALSALEVELLFEDYRAGYGQVLRSETRSA